MELCSGKSSVGDRKMPVSESVVDCVSELCVVKFVSSGEGAEEYTVIVVRAGEFGSV